MPATPPSCSRRCMAPRHCSGALPAVETYYKALSGRYGLVELTERYEGARLPDIEIIDMLDEKKRGRSSGSPLSMRLLGLTRETVDHGRQAILFHNRRGFAPVVMCKAVCLRAQMPVLRCIAHLPQASGRDGVPLLRGHLQTAYHMSVVQGTPP